MPQTTPLCATDPCTPHQTPHRSPGASRASLLRQAAASPIRNGPVGSGPTTPSGCCPACALLLALPMTGSPTRWRCRRVLSAAVGGTLPMTGSPTRWRCRGGLSTAVGRTRRCTPRPALPRFIGSQRTAGWGRCRGSPHGAKLAPRALRALPGQRVPVPTLSWEREQRALRVPGSAPASWLWSCPPA